MTIKEILVSVDASDTSDDRLQFALNLARRHGAHVTAYYTSPTVGQEPEGSAADIAESVEFNFHGQIAARSLKGKWILSGERLTEDLIEQVRYSDLAVLGLGPPERVDHDPQGFQISEIVTSCGRPILGVPVSRLSTESFSTALIAWDASREATRALHDAIPLMGECKQVLVASIGTQGRQMAERAVAHLAQHGISAEVDTTPAWEAEIGHELLQRAAMSEVDLMVAGAYGHSKLAENWLGGPSYTLLHQMLVPILLSH
jgi:nucleotide-binding universal stress UspA family protein